MHASPTARASRRPRHRARHGTRPGAVGATAVRARTVGVAMLGAVMLGAAMVGAACAAPAGDDVAGLDAMNARLVDAYRREDPAAYAALFTDTAVFAWPATADVRGRPALAAMARGNWAGLRAMELRLRVASRRVAGAEATEFGAFEQSWADSAGVRRTEYGRYVTALRRAADGSWRMDRFLGFEDSTRVVGAR